MAFSRPTLRSWLIPLIFVALATVLTVPWAYWVINTANDRHVSENAMLIARRVEYRVSSQTSNTLGNAQLAAEALNTELKTDATVELAIFCDMSIQPNYITWTRVSGAPLPTFSMDEIRRRASGDVTWERDGEHVIATIPWRRGPQKLGFTYLQFSRQALRDEFWQKDGPLLRRVIGLTGAAIAFLSALGILAYRAWMKVGHVQERAELTHLGLVAERGLTAAVLAHEIRNPLAALRFQLHSLRRNSADAQRVVQTADTIDSELSRVQQLVSDYLEHEKARTMRVQQVELYEAARALQALLRDMLRLSNIDLSVFRGSENVVVACDPHALRQVLMNLVLNAQQAMERDARKAAETGQPARRGAITIRVSIDEGYGCVAVSDNGPGIPPEMRDRLFKPFQTTREEGHGIGLALVKRFADNFGGNVRAESAAGQGATFILRLPLAESAEADMAGDEDETNLPAGPEVPLRELPLPSDSHSA